MTNWAVEIGCGEQDITPQPGTPLSGFIFRENAPSTHIDEALHVRALAVRPVGGDVHVLISYELLGISEPLERIILVTLENRLGDVFSRERTVLVATHTHSAPPASPLEGEAAPDARYWSLVCERTLDAVQDAIEQLQPANLHFASAWLPGHTYNRRAVLADGRVSMALEPDAPVLERGPVDDTLTLLVWRDQSGKNIAGLVHFACHGVAVCGRGIGGDVPGELMRRFAHALGAPCLFLQGAAGDINPLAVSGEYAGLIAWADDFWSQVKHLPNKLRLLPSMPFRTATTVVPLLYQPLPARSVVIRSIESFERIAAGDVDSPDLQETLRRLGNIMNVTPGQRPDMAKAAYASKALASAEERVLEAIKTPPAPFPLRVTVWQAGPVILAFVAAELFALTGFRIRSMGRRQAVLPVTYAAPIAGYVPDAAAMEKGGYEVDDAWRFYRQPAPFTPDSEQRILDAIAALRMNLTQDSGGN